MNKRFVLRIDSVLAKAIASNEAKINAVDIADGFLVAGPVGSLQERLRYFILQGIEQNNAHLDKLIARARARVRRKKVA